MQTPPYSGDANFLSGSTARTKAVWEALILLFKQEREKGVLDMIHRTFHAAM